MKTNQLLHKVLKAGIFASVLLCSNSLFAQLKIGSNPTVIGANRNLEIEADNGKKVIVNKVDGTLVIENTPDAATDDKFLKIDAAGNVKKLAQFVPMVKVAAQNSSGSNTLGVNGIQRMTLNPSANYVSLYDAALKEFTIAETGLYLVSMGGQFKGGLATPTNAQFQVLKSGSTSELITTFGGPITNIIWYSGNGTSPFLLTAGDKIFMQAVTNDAQTLTYQKLNLIIMRVE